MAEAPLGTFNIDDVVSVSASLVVLFSASPYIESSLRCVFSGSTSVESNLGVKFSGEQLVENSLQVVFGNPLNLSSSCKFLWNGKGRTVARCSLPPTNNTFNL